MEDNKSPEETVVTQVIPSDVDSELKGKKGAFAESVTRGNKKIRTDRALDILDGAQRAYKRDLEDSVEGITKLRRQLRAMIDLSPTDANSLKMVDDFDEKLFVARRRDLLKQIETNSILLRSMMEDYKMLFGEEFKVN